MNELQRSIFRAAIGLGLFAVITSGLIAATQTLTKERIEIQIKKAKAKALLEIVPADIFDNDLLQSAQVLPDSAQLGVKNDEVFYSAQKEGHINAVILPVIAPDGYSGPIRLVVSISRDGKVLGSRVIEHKETPGLGDKVEARKSDWIHRFEGRSLGNPSLDKWKVKKDGGNFDQFTGATITPRAVVGATKKALLYFEKHQAILLNTQQTPEASPHG